MSKDELNDLIAGGNITISVDLNTLRKVIRETVAQMQPPDDPTGPDRFLTAEQTADLLSVDRSTLYRWEKKGILAPCRIGGLVRYRESDILGLMEGNSDE